jgi:AcrR family transcriptional regulator
MAARTGAIETRRLMNNPEKRHPDLERTSSRRKQVLDAAECCFRRSGFHGASMSEISKAAGMSAGHIYNYFDSKDAIIGTFVEQNIERISALVLDLKQRDDPLQAMIDDVERCVNDNLHPGTWVLPLEIFAEASRNPAVATLLQDADNHSRSALRTVVKLGRAKRGLAHDDALLDGRIEALISMFQGLHLRALHNPKLNEAATVAAFRMALAALLLSE